MNSKGKKELAEAVREKLRTRGIKQKDFALEQRLSHKDFRIQLNRNSFSFHTLQSIADLLTDGSTDKLKEKFVFREIQKRKEEIVPATQIIQEEIIRSLKPLSNDDKLVQNIGILYSSLRKHDLVVICTFNEPPLENTFEGWDAFGASYIDAVQTGTIFLYIRPSKEFIKTISPALFGFFGPKTVQQEIQELRDKVAEGGVNVNDAKNNIKLYETDFCPFWAMDMRFGFYSMLKEDGKNRDMTLLAKFPFGGNLPGDGKVLLVANNRMRNAFQAYLTDCFNSKPALKPLLNRLKPNQ